VGNIQNPWSARVLILDTAKVIKMEGKVGCIKEGAFADFILLGANPLEDIAVMGRPDKNLKAVVKDGRCVRSTVPGLKVEVNLY
jgi:imidazolonepropionase-like amidohydrolase